MKRLLYLIPFLASISFAEVEQIGPFGGLNNSANSFVIPSNQAQDLLNVETSEGAKSIKKRKGYGTAFTLSNATSPLHGVYNFYDTDGSDVSLFFNDRNINRSVSGQAVTSIYTTATNGVTWQCTDSAGFAYCANTGRDGIFKIDASAISTLSGFTSTGTMVAVTPERLVQAGFSTDPNVILFSKANDFTDWTLGGDPTDPIQFTITSPGSGVKCIAYGHGRVYWWKDSSFGYILEGASQSDWRVVTIDPGIGSINNTFIYREEILYFQGNDGHFYAYDGSQLVQLSKDIANTITATQGRTSNAWSQTSQDDFENGLSTPTGHLSMVITPGSVAVSSYSATESTASQFSSGSFTDTRVSGNTIILSTTSTNMANNSFESGATTDAYNWTEGGLWRRDGTITSKCGSVAPYDGSYLMISTHSQIFAGNEQIVAEVIRASDSVSLISSTHTPSGCKWSTGTFTAGSNIGQVVKFRFTSKCPTGCTSMTLVTTTSYILGGDMTYRYRIDAQDNTPSAGIYAFVDYLLNGVSTITAGHFVSQTYDTGVSSSIIQLTAVSISSNTNTINIGMKTSGSSLGSFTEILTSSGTNAAAQRYVKYVASFTTLGSSDLPLSSLNSVTFVSRATGSYISEVRNAPNLTSWDSFGALFQENDGSINFYIRASTGSFTMLSSTPGWTSITDGGIPTASTGTYFQVLSSFTVTAATQNPTLNSFVVNWFEGSASDKSYAIYHDDANWWSVASGTGATTNNKILRFDLLNPGWYIYDIGMAGMYVRSQSLYFGSVADGKVFKFGDIDNDNGAAINSYWQSKDFFGSSPFLDKNYTRLSSIHPQVSNSTMTVTYEIDGSTATAYNVNLTNANSSFVQKNVNLPQGRTGKTINVKFWNNAADQPWEVFGSQVDYTPKSWVPSQ